MWNLTTSQCELFKVGVRQELDQYDGDLLKYMTCRERGIFKPKPMPKSFDTRRHTLAEELQTELKTEY